MPVPYSVGDLKARFETGDVPSQQDFADLIDTINYWFQAAQTTANGAVTTANLALAATGKTFLAMLGGVAPTIYDQQNIASVVYVGVVAGLGTKYRINFTTPFVDARYVPVFLGGSGWSWVNPQNAAYLDIYSGSGATATVSLFCYGLQ